MANMSEHQREAERALAALTSGRGIVETPRFKEMVVAAIAKPPRQRSGAERHLIEIAQALWAREHQRLVQEGNAQMGAVVPGPAEGRPGPPVLGSTRWKHMVVRAAGKDPKDRTQYEVRVLHEAKKLERLEQ